MRRRAFLATGGALVAGAALGCGTRRGSGSRPDWRALARSIDGEVLTPGDTGYDAAYRTFIERFDGIRPDAVVRCAGPADVQEAVRFAAFHEIHAVPRAGGHSFAGYSTTTGMVIDVGPMREVRMAGDRLALGGGTLLVDAHAAMRPHGVGLPTGTCPTVGMAGLTLGGGLGLTGRMYGLTSDRLTAAAVVLGDGRHVVADDERHPDLFWALRGGGGGNFGVVTELEYRTHPVDAVTVFVLDWAAEHAPGLVAAWQEWAPHAPDALSTNMVLAAGGPDDPPLARAFGQWLGPRSELDTLLDRLLDGVGRTPARVEMLETMPYHDAVMYWAGCSERSPAECRLPGETPGGELRRYEYRLTKSDFFVRPMPAEAARVLIDALLRDRRSGQVRALEFAAFGGAYNRVAPEATAFVHRDRLYDLKYATTMSMRGSDADKAHARSWIDGIRAAMRPWASGYSYQNYIDRDLADWRRAYYGANYPRLVEVKRRYDPAGFFRFPQAVGAPG